MLIVFEGVDRSGKSTQCRMLKEALEELGYRVKYYRYPDRTLPHTGAVVNEYLAKTIDMPPNAASLLLASVLWAQQDTLRLEDDNTIVLMDRHVWSSIAYSVTRGMDESVMRRISKGLQDPDLILFIDAPPELAARRGDFGKERFDKIEFQASVASIMRRLSEESTTPVFKLDASLDPSHISRTILATVLSLVVSKSLITKEKGWPSASK